MNNSLYNTSHHTLLEMKNVRKIYAQGDTSIGILRNINLNVNYGEFVSITGESGSGKSTLLNLAALLDGPDGGIVKFSNIPPQHDELIYLRRYYIGFVYQKYNLFPDLNVYQNVIVPLLLQHGGNRISTVPKEGNVGFMKATKILQELGIAHKINSKIFDLSGGEQQRVAIARSLIHNPKIIFADEPTGNLDPDTAENVFNMFIDQVKRNNTALVLVTHNLDLANRADKKYKLENGELVEIK